MIVGEGHIGAFSVIVELSAIFGNLRFKLYQLHSFDNVLCRFAPHLEKCMGMGRNSSRVASRRLANTNKDSYREGGHEDEDDDDDEWVEPGKKEMRRRRDKNSPRRNKSLKFKGGEYGDGSGTITPPQSYDHLSLEERRSLLTSACGVTLSNNKICLRPTRCSAHTDHQRREVRLKWLGGRGSSAGDLEELDLDSDGDTVALRESLSQLSNASSPAESVVSTSSNPGSLVAHSSRHSSHSSRHKGKRGKKGRPGSKNGSSRGSTPPMEH